MAEKLNSNFVPKYYQNSNIIYIYVSFQLEEKKLLASPLRPQEGASS